jgi:deazaflavin-dependent oxidoreductase (nitroreductase family)
MTATQSASTTQVKPVNRALLHTFWTLHRSLYRITGGRIGLQAPEQGTRFGMLRLHTEGRRSGRDRITMVGYYPDGQNLVTLAMNGWGKAEPAWWLNLQANPSATVELPDGPRTVTARQAAGAERERLWATFREYPGWGADIDGLASFRPDETAIVVFEPASAATSLGGGTATAGAQAAVEAAPKTGRGFRLRPRHLWLVPGFAIAIYANQLGTANGVGILALIGFGIVPDLPRLFGSLGRPIHNVLHSPILATAAVAVAATGIVSTFWLVGALVWFGHVVAGRGIGDQPRRGGK